MNFLETILSKLFPPRMGRIDGVILEREPHPLVPQYPALREGEDGIGQKIEHGSRLTFRDGIERMRFEADYAEFLKERLQ